MMGLIGREIRLPMTEPDGDNLVKIKKAMQDYGLKV
jgi:hypothetical protein